MSERLEESLLPYINMLWKNRKLIISGSFIAGVVAIVYTFFFADLLYRSEVQFLPPLGGSSSSAGLLSQLGMSLPTGNKINPYQIPEIFNTRNFQWHIIDKFNLIKRYNNEDEVNKYILTAKKLSKNLSLNLSEIGNLTSNSIVMYSISMVDTSAAFTKEVTDYTFKYLDSITVSIVSSNARNKRLYIEEQYNIKRDILDSLQKEFHKFQVDNKAYALPEQINASVEQIFTLKSMLEQNEITLNILKLSYSPSHTKIKSLKKENYEIKKRLAQYENSNKNNLLPSLKMGTKLIDKYTEYLTQIKFLTEMKVFLQKQFEEARIEESNRSSGLLIVSPAVVPEYKYKPKRVLLVIIIFVTIVSIMIFILFILEFYREISKSKVYKRIVNELKQ